MSIKQKISESIYEIYVERFPDVVEDVRYRGDYFSFTLKGFNQDDTPFDFSIYDSFRAQLRVGNPNNRNVQYEFDESEFLLGKIDEQDEEFGELHVISEQAMDLDRPYPNVWFDVHGILNGEIKTFIKVNFNIDPDVTK